MFLALKALGEGLKMLLELQNQRSNVWEFDFIWVLKCSLTGLSTLPALPFYWQGFFSSGLWLMGRLRDQADWHTRLPLFSFHHSASYFHPPMACSLLFQPLYFVLDGTKTNRLVLDLSKVRMSCTSASEQSQSPAVRVAAFHFWVAEWTFSCACVQQALCVNSAFLLQQSSDHGKNFT